jgi:hypothetical protein
MSKYHIFFLQITCIFKVRLNAHTKKQNNTYKIKNKTKNKTKQNKRNKKPKRKWAKQKIHVICRKKIWYLPIRNRLCISTKVVWINKKLWYKTPINTFYYIILLLYIPFFNWILGFCDFHPMTNFVGKLHWNDNLKYAR